MSQHPNILFITSDQHRGDCFGFTGRQVQTPHLDQLANEGTRFNACITPSAMCQPARASILTGLYPRSHGVVDNGIDLPPETGEKGFAGQLAQAGYATAFIGKAHFSSYNTFQATGTPECHLSSPNYADDWHGPYMGFQHTELAVLGHELIEMAQAPKGLHYERWLRSGEHGEERLKRYGERLAPDVGALQTWNSALPVAWHHSSWVADRTVAYLQNQKQQQQPFCLWASFPDPHMPFDCPEPWSRQYHPDEVDLPAVRERNLDRRPWWHRAYIEDKSVDPDLDKAMRDHTLSLTRLPRRNGRARDYNDSEEQLRHTIANYYGMVSLIDHNVGRMLNALDDMGLADNTLVVFCSDHGEWLGDHGMLLKGPMFYEGLLRVGLLVRGPNVPAGKVLDDPVANTDLGMTFMDYAQTAPNYASHGQSIKPLLETDTASRDFAYGEWDLNPDHWGLDLKLRVVRTQRHKLTLEANSGAGELYDLVDDPLETVNLFDDDGAATIRKELMDMIASRPDDCLQQPLIPSGVH